ncbi:LPXTG cell wall anchor domain-containing protein [Microbacterium xylanilyticum]
MMRKFSVLLTVAALLVLGPAAGANAADEVPPSPGSTDNYTPTQHELNLNGSSAVAQCISGAPWITFSVTLIDPDNVSTGHVAHLILSDGTNTDDIVLGPLVNNTISGRILWPGASVDAQGKANGWPGWETQNGQLVSTNGNFAWTRGDITAEIKVNPTATVSLHYPPATVGCTDPAGHGSDAAALATTGMSGIVLPIGIVGVVTAVAGAAAMLIARRRVGRH